jgi:uncharacterized repeat protein (TIGR03803 family)
MSLTPESRRVPLNSIRFSASVFLLLVLTFAVGLRAEAQTFKVLHDFSGGSDGATPLAGLTRDLAGSLYGTASAGGAKACGTVFRLVPRGDNWSFYVLYAFRGLDDLRDGSFPYAPVTLGPDGLLYGTTHSGGDGNGCPQWHGCGTVFQLRPAGTIGSWEENVLHRFGMSDGSNPDQAELVFDRAGNLYGATRNGGDDLQGVVYEVSRNGVGWSEKVLYSFRGSPDGATPLSGPVPDQDGNLYGATSAGGANGWGMVYQIQPSGAGWNENILYSFQNSGDGSAPAAGVSLDTSGNFYGATQSGGTGGGGTVFELSLSALGSWSLTALYGLPGPPSGGPSRGLVADSAGNLYGTTTGDGSHQWGSVFKLTRSGGAWTYTSLHDFTGGPDGAAPYSKLVVGANGKLYGTASAGGASGNGVIFEITP